MSTLHAYKEVLRVSCQDIGCRTVNRLKQILSRALIHSLFMVCTLAVLDL